MEEEKRGVFSGVETSICYGMDLIKFVLVRCHLYFFSLTETLYCTDIDQLIVRRFSSSRHQRNILVTWSSSPSPPSLPDSASLFSSSGLFQQFIPVSCLQAEPQEKQKIGESPTWDLDGRRGGREEVAHVDPRGRVGQGRPHTAPFCPHLIVKILQRCH